MYFWVLLVHANKSHLPALRYVLAVFQLPVIITLQMVAIVIEGSKLNLFWHRHPKRGSRENAKDQFMKASCVV